MNRILMTGLILALVFCCCSDGGAQTIVSPAITAPKTKEKVAVSPRSITLHPQQQPDPMLRYRFWPAPEKQLQQRAMPIISRALILSLQVNTDAKQAVVDRFVDLSWTQDGSDFPVEEIRAQIAPFRFALKELGHAENRMQTQYDLQLDQLTASELLQTLLPELQQMRDLARVLQLRMRLAIAEQRWEDAIDDCRLGFRLAEAAAHSTDFLLGRIVGFAISGIMMSAIEEAIQHPDCPSLYWALACLPESRLFETRDSIQFESIAFSRVFSVASDLPDEPIGEDAARAKVLELVQQANELMGSGEEQQASADLLTGLYVLSQADASRDTLAALPNWRDRAKDLSAVEAVLRASVLKCARDRDRWVAWSLLPEEAWEEYKDERMASLDLRESDSTDILKSLMRMLTPAVDHARSIGLRSNQQRNYLLTLEALRMHAAIHGQLPATLDKLRPVPAWNDSLGNQPFGYQRSTPTTATLTRTPNWNHSSETTFQIELKGLNE
ncbi:MAG: hypothetical protein AB8B91_08420 [Rubripirellula sp.]